MRKNQRHPDAILEIDTSDHALGAILTKCPNQELEGLHTHRRLTAHEITCSSCLREMAGYDHASKTIDKAMGDTLRGLVLEIVGDAQSAVHVIAKGGSQAAGDDFGLLLITEALLKFLERECWQL